MAERRMFAKSIVLSDAFLDMPLTARCLYFTLGMLADDDGFVSSPKAIMRQCGASQDDMNVLLSKRYILAFDSGVIVIKHWRINNYLRNDRYQQTTYLEEKDTLDVDARGAYTEKDKVGIPNMGIPSIGKVSLGKDRLGKDKDNNNINNKSSAKPTHTPVYYPSNPELDKAFKDYIAFRKQIKATMTDRAIELAIKKLETLSNGDDDISIQILNQSIMNGWKGLFSLKQDNKSSASVSPQTLAEKWGLYDDDDE